jgi:hypothetical protein
MAVYTCYPSYMETEIGRIFVPGPSGKQVHSAPSQWKKLDTVDVPVTSAKSESSEQEDCGPADSGKKQDPISKITRAKRARGMAA